MNCREVLEKLSEFLDGELDEKKREELQRHVENCSDCLRKHDLEKAFHDALRKRAAEDRFDTSELQSRIRAEIDNIDSGTGKKNILYLLAPLAAAAVVAFVMFVPLSSSISDSEAFLQVIAPYATEHQNCLDKLVNWNVVSSDPKVIDSCLSLIAELPQKLLEFNSENVTVNSAAISHLPAGDASHIEFEAWGKGVSLFVLAHKLEDKSPFRKIVSNSKEMYVGSCPHFQYVIFNCEGRDCLAVSTMPEENLVQFASMF